MTTIRLTVNGEAREAQVDPRTTLLHFLREALHLTGTKESCAEGECGACTVWLDGRTVNACLVFAVEADGREVTTIEGLRSGRARPLIEALAALGGVQCGFCVPGIVMSAAKLLETTPNPTREDVLVGLSGNLCRCTGYQKIIEAILTVAHAPAAAPGGDRS
ncbi:MAG TPA: (2Fe-2S)-binding protein [Thermodesulfobacteriota bacterium]